MKIRKAIPKKIRQIVYQKCGGHCAYCGCKLNYSDMQVDHVDSVWANTWRNKELTDEELNCLDNYMPTCRACNFYKGACSLEKFRENISGMLYRNLADNFNYKMLKKYNLIRENIHPIRFYFEEMEEKENRHDE